MVLGYHQVSFGGALAVTPDTFARHMALVDAGRHRTSVASLDDALHAADAGVPGRRLVITFDDAWADNHTFALPVLSAYRLPATLYVPSGLLGTPGYLTPAALREMVDSGVTVGAHSRTHPDLRSCSPSVLDDEIRGSRADLEDLLGRPVTSFAYPAGFHDDRVVKAVAAAGFRSAVTTRRGWLRAQTRRLRIPRCFVEPMADATFSAALSGGLTVVAPLDWARGVHRRKEWPS